MIAEFQEPETEPSVFILSLKAGGVGITLTKPTTYSLRSLVEPSSRRSSNRSRFPHRSKEKRLCPQICCHWHPRKRIDQMIEDKKKLSSAVISSDESWLTELNNEAFKQLIALNKSAILDKREHPLPNSSLASSAPLRFINQKGFI